MGVKLYVEALHHGPQAVKGSELVVLLVLCEDANDATRRTWLGMDALCKRSRLGESTARGHVTKLEERKVIRRVDAPRVQPGASPVVAHRGHRTVYEILPMSDMSDTEAPGSRRLPGAKGARNPAERRQDPGEKAPGSWPPSPHVPAGPLITPAVIEACRDALRDRSGREISREWAETVAVSLLSGRAGISAPARWIRTVIQREQDLQRFLPVPRA